MDRCRLRAVHRAILSVDLINIGTLSPGQRTSLSSASRLNSAVLCSVEISLAGGGGGGVAGALLEAIVLMSGHSIISASANED
jgi:hypothetical protein